MDGVFCPKNHFLNNENQQKDNMPFFLNEMFNVGEQNDSIYMYLIGVWKIFFILYATKQCLLGPARRSTELYITIHIYFDMVDMVFFFFFFLGGVVGG